MLKYEYKEFYDLSPEILYKILQLRQLVFVVEQNCVYLDCDNLDMASFHLTGTDEFGNVLTYARLLPPGAAYSEFSSIGRIVTSPAIRGSGQGKILVSKAISILEDKYPTSPIKISAQYYLLDFYREFDFELVGDQYLEDDIPHIAMIRPAKIE